MSARTRTRWTRLRLAIVVSIVPVAWSVLAYAGDVLLPPRIQASLLVKFAAYDSTLVGLSTGTVTVVIATRQGDVESTKVGTQVRAELESNPTIVNLPHKEIAVPFTTAEALASTCKESKASILYLASGFEDEIPGIVRALGDLPVLTTGALPEYVPKGIVLGFDVVSGRPKLVVNLGQAKKQRLALSSNVLKLAQVIE